jgi:alkylation response protein AidB-like acyl-CoA dehydrogenase
VPVDRLLPTPEAEELLELVRDIADHEMAPIVDEYERTSRYPEGLFQKLGDAGLLGLPYPEEYGGGGQPYEVYLQVLEELASRWAAVAVAVSVHVLACSPLVNFGTEEQKREWLPRMLDGELIGGYSLSEPHAGSDAAALVCKAERVPAEGADGRDAYRITGTKAWITHGSRADFYALFARTGPGSRGVSCFLAPGHTEGLEFGRPESKMGLHAIPTTSAFWDGAVLDADRRIGAEGEGLGIAFNALDAGRLGIAAVATGLAQAALDAAVRYAQDRTAFGKRIFDHEGLGFLLADMAAAVDSSRATYLDAARRRDAGRPYSRQASVAKLIATDAAMKVTTDAVQVFGGYGYTTDFPVERYMREAKIMQIFEGTNQIQRLVISRGLTPPPSRSPRDDAAVSSGPSRSAR